MEIYMCFIDVIMLVILQCYIALDFKFSLQNTCNCHLLTFCRDSISKVTMIGREIIAHWLYYIF